MTHQRWYEALSHLFAMETNLTLNISVKPDEFLCRACALWKSISQKPKAIDPQSHSQSTKPLELFHSDLSAKFSIAAIGKKYHYMTLIDDYTRFG